MIRLFLWFTLLSVNLFASEQKELDSVGSHFEIFRFEKSENPQNVLVVYTKLDEQCRFMLEAQEPSRPVVGFYWLMDRRDYKPVHVLIRSGISEKLQVMLPPEFSKNRDYFSVQVKDLVQLDPKLGNSLVNVSAQKVGKDCQLKSTFNSETQVADSAGRPGTSMMLERIYAESEKTLLPPFRKVISLRFEGVDERTGIQMRKVFQGEGVK